jgi:hypothetical protein
MQHFLRSEITETLEKGEVWQYSQEVFSRVMPHAAPPKDNVDAFIAFNEAIQSLVQEGRVLREEAAVSLRNSPGVRGFSAYKYKLASRES